MKNKLFYKIVVFSLFIYILAFVSCGGGGGGAGGASIPASEYSTHNPTGWAGGGYEGGGSSGGSNGANNVIQGGTPLTVTGYSYNGQSYSNLQELVDAIGTDAFPAGETTISFTCATSNGTETRQAKVIKNASGNTVEHQYKATCIKGSDTEVRPFYKDNGLNISDLTTSNVAGWRCSQNAVLYGSIINGFQGDITLTAEFVSFSTSRQNNKTQLIATSDISVVDSETITITGGSGTFSVTGDSYLNVTQVSSNPAQYTVSIKINGTAFIGFNDNATGTITITDTGVTPNETQTVSFTLKNVYTYQLKNADGTNAGSAVQKNAGDPLDFDTAKSAITGVPTGREVVAFKNDAGNVVLCGNTGPTSITFNSMNFTSRSINLRAVLDFTMNVSGGQGDGSTHAGTAGDPYILKYNGTDNTTATKITAAITSGSNIGSITTRTDSNGKLSVTAGSSPEVTINKSALAESAIPPEGLLYTVTVKDYKAGTNADVAANVYSEKTFYVKIPQTSYNVTYNTVLTPDTPLSNSTYTPYEGLSELPSPTKVGYTFAGWYINQSFTGSAVSSIPAGATGNKTYYAKWTATVTFNSMGGDAVASQSVPYNSTATAPTVTKTGYEFKGWYTSTDGGITLSATPYNFSTAVTSAITLYAKWDEYTTFNGTAADFIDANFKTGSSLMSPYNVTITDASDTNLNSIANAIYNKGVYVNLTLESSGNNLTSINFFGYRHAVVYLISIVLPEGVTEIGYQAFQEDTYTNNLKSITLPASLTLIRGQAFTSCNNLTTVIDNGPSNWVKYDEDTIMSNIGALTAENIKQTFSTESKRR